MLIKKSNKPVIQDIANKVKSKRMIQVIADPSYCQ